MRPPFRGPMALIFSLLCVSVIAPLMFFSAKLPDFDRSWDRLGKASRFVKILTPEAKAAGGGLKEPTRLISENRQNHENGSRRDVLDRSTKASALYLITSPGLSNQTQKENVQLNSHRTPLPETDIKLRRLKDMLIMAKAYIQLTPTEGNSHFARELKLRIKDTEKIVSQATVDSDLSRSALQKMKSFEATLSKASKLYPDCSSMALKLRAMAYSSEDQLRTQKVQASYLVQLASRTIPKGLHCLQMQLTAEYFTLNPQEREFSHEEKLEIPNLYHYVIFSDNVLATAVVLNSTVYTSLEPEKIVLHVITDSLNFPAMRMWFLANKPGQATIQISNLEDFEWLLSGYDSTFKRSGRLDMRYFSPLNHLRFYLPDVFPYLDKVLFLDHDVVVQRDLRPLWDVDMKGKVNGAVKLSRGEKFYNLEAFLNFTDPSISENFNADSCAWAFGMNMFDLKEWRKQGLTKLYQDWLELGKTRQLWKVGSLPLGQITFYNRTLLLDTRWHALGLGVHSSLETKKFETSAVIHYDGGMKPWLDIAIPKYKHYWSKFLDFNSPYLQRCNIQY